MKLLALLAAGYVASLAAEGHYVMVALAIAAMCLVSERGTRTG